MKKHICTITWILLLGFIFSPTVTMHAQKDRSWTKEQAISLQNLPVMTFTKRHIDLGKVKKGDHIPFQFEFQNMGKTDLTIDFVSGCDCTELDWPVKTFKPGEKGKIDVIFLSDKKEKSETVEIDILLKNVNPATGNPILEIISYSYEF